ncbi:TetR/AcrR family transcriptional regulator [Natroniella acetigena]|uniref:TetR/AcrR family transcriptional regulator n=1 Tax=Natroniella acetigena TaxID=52004 RepID=UPI00200AFEFC|nr:TetR/AcrR family transcriptional regulator [Natroniella acetigena]MCK8827050.1 TetR/AcrR family transcriptional regulator [Natroniella acetigena]
MGEKVSNKKADIISAAIDLFSEQGFHETKVSEIADLARVAKGTVYWYFDSKKDLFQGILINKLEQLQLKVKEKIEVEIDPLEKLEEIIQLYFNFYQQGRKVSKMFRECTIAVDKEFFHDHIINFNRSQIESIAEVIDQAKEEKVIASHQDSLDLARVLLGMIRTFNPHLYYQNDLMDKVELIKDVFLNGVSR